MTGIGAQWIANNCVATMERIGNEYSCTKCGTGPCRNVAKSALGVQVAGNHYKELKIQPVEFIHQNEIGFMAGNVIKYVCRYKAKNGVQDLEKAKHYIEMLIEQETKESKHE